VLQEGGGDTRIGVPFSATAGVEEVCGRYGAECVRTRADFRSLMELAGDDPSLAFAGDSEGGFIFPRFLPAFDAMLAAGKLLELLAITGRRLRDVRQGIPRYARATRQVHCPWEHKGTVMRRLHEESRELRTEHVDGLKVHLDGDWVLVLPDVSAPVIHVKAETGEPGDAEELADRYAALLSELQGGL